MDCSITGNFLWNQSTNIEKGDRSPMTRTGSTAGLSRGVIYLSALSLSIGWGVRGSWGHEFGAMIPGALAAMAACLTGREDWRRRWRIRVFGALGWSFGGSMSYGMVLGFTHSARLAQRAVRIRLSVHYRFLWGAIGGAGTALPRFWTTNGSRSCFTRCARAVRLDPAVLAFKSVC